MKNALIFCLVFTLISCKNSTRNYKSDLDFLNKHTNTIELISKNGKSRLIVTPEFQGKVITSTFNGVNGQSNGWFNSKVLEENNLNNKKATCLKSLFIMTILS